MATKYGPRKKHNAGTVRKSTNNLGGSRTRSTTTTKFGNVTKSRSVNRNGTVRLTTTHKAPSGFITRSVQTIGSRPSKPKTPKFIKAKPFKAPKIRTTKTKSYSSGRSRRSRGGDGGGEFLLAIVLLAIAAPFWICKQFWKAAEQTIQRPEVEQLDTMTLFYTKVFFLFLVYIWLTVAVLYFIGKMI